MTTTTTATTTAHESTTAGSSRLGATFSVVALVEAFTWAGLLVGMYLKHIAGTTEVGVQVFGMAHGIVVMVYVAVTVVAAARLRWSKVETVLALVAALPPLATVPLERWLRRRGALGPRR